MPMATGRKKGRPALGNDPAKMTALQASLLSQALSVGVPVDAKTVDRVAGALAKLSTVDVRAVEALKDSPLALEALARLSVEDPDAFLKHIATFMEFTRPKLARVEHKHEGTGIGVFVAVEQREQGPPEKLVGKVISDQ